MEINSLGESRVGKSNTDKSDNLLRQLRASGSIDAVVLKLLPGKLLLGSQIGEILTANTLNLRPGDRIRVRLDDSGAQPVLKVSRDKEPSLTIPASADPRLKQALPDRQLRLALVLQVAKQATEIQLADARFNLPGRLPAVSKDLLTLRRDDSRDQIEIRVLDKKPIYKALLQQLLPRQQRNGVRESSLVRLVDLVRGIVTDQSRVAGASANSRTEPKAVRDNPQRATETVSTASRPSPARTALASLLPASAAIEQSRSATTNPAGRPAPAPNATAGQSARNIGTPAPLAPRLTTTTAETSSKPVPRNTLGPDAGSARTDSVFAAPLFRASVRPPPNTGPVWQQLLTRKTSSPAAPSGPGVTTTKPASPQSPGDTAPRPVLSDRGGLTTAASPVKPVAAAAARSGTAASTPGQATRATLTAPATTTTSSMFLLSGSPPAGNAGTAASASPTSMLVPLLQRLPDFAAIDRSDIHRWLELSGLAQAKPQSSARTATSDLARLLSRLADGEAFDRELRQLIQARNQAGDGEEKPARQLPVENWPASIRDGLKLVEQSLASNLLQRASIGLQQETQQPSSLSFALPVIDQQEVKPLWIDLQQRGKASDDEGQGWDLRLAFEFGDLGPVSCHIFLQGFRIAVSFYSDRESTRDSIDNELPQLRRQLVAAGFDPGEFHSFPAALAPAPATGAEFAESLIDVEV